MTNIKGGVTVDKKRTTEGGVEVPYLRVANVQEGRIDLHEIKRITVPRQVVEELRLQPGDILLNEGGDRDKLGRGWVWDGQLSECIHQNHVFRARPISKEISSKFISYYTNAFGKPYFMGEGKQTTNLASLSLSKLKALPVPVAPSGEQARIVSRIEELFSGLDKGEESLRQAQAQLKRYRQSVLKAAVTGELTRAWREQNADKVETGEALLRRILKARREAWEKAELEKLRAKGMRLKGNAWKARYVEPKGPDSEGLPKLPEGWTWATFVQIGEFGRGKSKHRPRNDPKLYGGAYPFLQTGTVRASNGRIRSYDSTYNDTGLAQSKLWPEGTICITIAANIAESGILDFPACFPDSIVGLVPSEGIITEFIEFFIRTAREKLDTYAPATAQKNINLEILEKVAIPLPPTAEQHEVYSQAWERLSAIEAVEVELSRQLARSDALRQSILKSAFSGTLVPQDPGDEPAAELLKRIAAERAKQAGKPAGSAAPRRKRVAPQPAPTPPGPSAPAGLAAARKAAGLSQVQLARATGVNQAYISQMETGKRTMTPGQAAAIATALGIEPSALAGRDRTEARSVSLQGIRS